MRPRLMAYACRLVATRVFTGKARFLLSLLATLLQNKIKITVEDVVRPVALTLVEYCFSAGQQGSAYAAACKYAVVEGLRKCFRRLVIHRPVGAQIIGDSAPHQRLCHPGRLGDLLARWNYVFSRLPDFGRPAAAHTSRLAGIEKYHR